MDWSRFVLEEAMISCVCISENRVHMLRRAVFFFEQQTYPNRELVIVYQARDRATCDYIRSLKNPAIRPVEVPLGMYWQLGGLRNLGIAASQGSYVATWDDDDWHAPERLQVQMDTIREHKRPACVLRRCQVYDMTTGNAYVSGPYTWELSMLAAKDGLPEYPNITRGEDRHVVGKLLRAHQLVELDYPDLYIYVYHGLNTCGRTHFKRNVFGYGELLSKARAEGMRQRLGL